ncbi:MAG: metal-dependent transcriptional regulator [Bacillota bacterium]
MAKDLNLTPSNEDYLEAILRLMKNGSTRSVDVAKELNVTKPAVSVAANDLIAKGLITKEAYSDIILTEDGRKVALSITCKHVLLKRFLLTLGATEENAEIECCKLEHIFSDHTMSCIANFCMKNPYEAEAGETEDVGAEGK